MAKLTDKLVGKGTGTALSPNPNGTGYTKQVEVDSLVSVESPESNVLYICKGRYYKYLRESVIDPGTNKIIVPAGWVRVENGPDLLKEDGGRSTPVIVNQEPTKRPHIYNEPVALNGGVTIDGKELQDYIDSKGGVTEEELANAVQTLNTKIENVVKAGSQINLGTILVTTDSDEVNHAQFLKEITGAEVDAIPASGLCILMFNTTCVLFPFVKAYPNRTVVNAIAYNNGSTMVVRTKLEIDTSGPNYIKVTFEEAYADALVANTEVRPYGVIQFIKLG